MVGQLHEGVLGMRVVLWAGGQARTCAQDGGLVSSGVVWFSSSSFGRLYLLSRCRESACMARRFRLSLSTTQPDAPHRRIPFTYTPPHFLCLTARIDAHLEVITCTCALEAEGLFPCILFYSSFVPTHQDGSQPLAPQPDSRQCKLAPALCHASLQTLSRLLHAPDLGVSAGVCRLPSSDSSGSSWITVWSTKESAAGERASSLASHPLLSLSIPDVESRCPPAIGRWLRLRKVLLANGVPPRVWLPVVSSSSSNGCSAISSTCPRRCPC